MAALCLILVLAIVAVVWTGAGVQDILPAYPASAWVDAPPAIVEPLEPETSSPSTDDTSPDTSEPDAQPFTRGKISGNTYTSDFAGLDFTAPSGWLIVSDEDFARYAGEDAHYYDDLADYGVIADMFAVDYSTGTNLIILYEDATATGTDMTVTEEQYLDSLKVQLESEWGALSSYYTFSEYYKTELQGERYTCMDATAPALGLTQHYYVRPEGEYMIHMVLTSLNGEDPSSILANFTDMR